ncbi:MAG TPA: hypothetical protein VN738_11330 [Acidothermaceae bacterium]|nr:hypothetical protein [Acidothermaceae bacterium]
MTTPTPPPQMVTVDKTKAIAILASITALIVSLLALLNVNDPGSGTSASASSAPSPVVSSSSPTPSASTAVTGCLARLAACGYPDATNTGAHGTLTPHAGKLVTTADGQIVENLDIAGCLQIVNKNVTVRNVKVEGGCTYSLDTSKATGPTTISDVTVIGSSGQAATVVLREGTATRLDVSGGNDGVKIWGSGAVVFSDSYVHNLTRTTGSHDDAVQVQSGGDVALQHLTLLPFDGTDPMNSCLQIGALTGNLASLTMAASICDGGNYSVLANSTGVGSTVTAGPIVISGNRFGTDYRYGTHAHLGPPLNTTWSGNVDDATGNPL